MRRDVKAFFFVFGKPLVSHDTASWLSFSSRTRRARLRVHPGKNALGALFGYGGSEAGTTTEPMTKRLNEEAVCVWVV